MSLPTTAREALILEAIGEVAQLLQRVEALKPALDESCRALMQASKALRDDVTIFARQLEVITESAKTQTVRHMAARTDEATRRSIDLQSRAMADAARVAFGAELGATMQRLQTTLQPLLEERQRRWECWLTHAAAAAVSSAATWSMTVYFWPR
jgi:hypothetical protein